MWTFYLAYSEAGFRSGYLDVHQLQLTRNRRDHGERRGTGGWRPLLEDFLGGTLPVRLRAWDGSEAGAEGRAGGRAALPARAAPAGVAAGRTRPGARRTSAATSTSRATSPRACAPCGARCGTAAWPRPAGRRATGHAPRLAALRLGAVGPRPPAPGAQARLRGGLHSTARDRAAISHHYDLSNDWYELLLDETMAYSCGYWTSLNGPEGRRYGPADAQRDKLDLICRKLDLAPGSRLLDIGCGWGSLTLHAAEECKAEVTAVTLSREQAAYVRARVARARPGGPRRGAAAGTTATSRPGSYDAVSTIEMGEHVGDAEYPAFTAAAAVAAAPARPGAGAADVTRPARARRRRLHRDLHRPRHAHAAAGRDRRTCWRAPVWRCGTWSRCASTTPATIRAWRSHPGGPLGASSSPSPVRRPRGCGGCTWSAARSPSRSAAWASTRSSPSAPTTGGDSGMTEKPFAWRGTVSA